MDDFARLTSSERREIIAEAAIGMKRDFTIIEKDFWVCWTLRSLFSLPSEHAAMVFKGGTSLSKAYGLIERFSEDIDVVTDVDFYLAHGAANPETAPSRTQQLERMAALDATCANYVAGDLLNELRRQFAARLGTTECWELLIDSNDRYSHTLLFRYPISAPDIEHTYIRGHIKIELGWRSTTTPAETRTFNSYLAEHFPHLMERPDVHCITLLPARTFWEKVTALHAESFRDEVPHFFSRHYSDVAAMFQTELGQSASRDLAMLSDVRRFKQRYYPAAWARYDLAVPGSLAIVPLDVKLRALVFDYRDMRMMFLQDPPTFEKIIEQLRALQTQINAA
jgi:hypothetical protein